MHINVFDLSQKAKTQADLEGRISDGSFIQVAVYTSVWVIHIWDEWLQILP